MSSGESIVRPHARAGRRTSRIALAIVYPLLMIGGGLSLFLGNLLLWVDSSVMDSDNFSATVE